MPNLSKRNINIEWEDFEGNQQKLVLKRPKNRDLKHLRSALIPFNDKLKAIKEDPENVDESFSNMDIEILNIIVSRLKESSSIALDSEDDWLDLDSEDTEKLADVILEKCNYFLAGSPKLKKE